jgi:hypothetical protein
MRVCREIEVDYRVGNLISNLIGMAFRNRFAGKEIAFARHGLVPFFAKGGNAAPRATLAEIVISPGLAFLTVRLFI